MRARVEGEVRKLLLDFLPKKYEYGSGIVIDSSGGEVDRSRQEDILVIDKFFNPRLFLDEEPTVYPVKTIYCGVEVKTSIDAGGLRSAIDNIASLKRLKFVRDGVTYVRGNAIIAAQTSAPMGVIFAFDTQIRSAETLLRQYASSINGIEAEARPDFICILNRGMLGISTETSKPRFHLYGLLGTDQVTGRMNALEVSSTAATPPNELIASNGQRYPVIKMNGRYYPVDVARTFIGFLGTLYEMLVSKVMMANTNLLQHYIPSQMTHHLYKDHVDNDTSSEGDA